VSEKAKPRKIAVTSDADSPVIRAHEGHTADAAASAGEPQLIEQ
jgi:hypothetical protein